MKNSKLPLIIGMLLTAFISPINVSATSKIYSLIDVTYTLKKVMQHATHPRRELLNLSNVNPSALTNIH